MLNRRCYDAVQGEYVYVFQDILNNTESLFKIGKTKNLQDREKFYSNINTSGGIIYFQKCLNCTLIKNLSHHILDNYRVNKMQEWFNISSELAIKTIQTIIFFTDSNQNKIETFIPKLHEIVKCDIDNVDNTNADDVDVNNAETESDNTELKNIYSNNFEKFIQECCEENEVINFQSTDELCMIKQRLKALRRCFY